jgi:hypothetical protein
LCLVPQGRRGDPAWAWDVGRPSRLPASRISRSRGRHPQCDNLETGRQTSNPDWVINLARAPSVQRVEWWCCLCIRCDPCVVRGTASSPLGNGFIVVFLRRDRERGAGWGRSQCAQKQKVRAATRATLTRARLGPVSGRAGATSARCTVHGPRATLGPPAREGWLRECE